MERVNKKTKVWRVMEIVEDDFHYEIVAWKDLSALGECEGEHLTAINYKRKDVINGTK